MTRAQHRNNEDGMTTIEAAVLAPVILVLMLFIVFLGRVITTQQAVQRAEETRRGPRHKPSPATTQLWRSTA